jgi:hypothetical protein
MRRLKRNCRSPVECCIGDVRVPILSSVLCPPLPILAPFSLPIDSSSARGPTTPKVAPGVRLPSSSIRSKLGGQRIPSLPRLWKAAFEPESPSSRTPGATLGVVGPRAEEEKLASNRGRWEHCASLCLARGETIPVLAPVTRAHGESVTNVEREVRLLYLRLPMSLRTKVVMALDPVLWTPRARTPFRHRRPLSFGDRHTGALGVAAVDCRTAGVAHPRVAGCNGLTLSGSNCKKLAKSMEAVEPRAVASAERMVRRRLSAAESGDSLLLRPPSFAEGLEDHGWREPKVGCALAAPGSTNGSLRVSTTRNRSTGRLILSLGSLMTTTRRRMSLRAEYPSNLGWNTL